MLLLSLLYLRCCSRIVPISFSSPFDSVEIYSHGEIVNVLLIYPDHTPDPLIYGESEEVFRHFSNCEPLGLEYLATAIKDLCNSIQLIDLRFEKRPLDLVLTQEPPDIVGISGYSMHVPEILRILQQIKKNRPETITVVGGIHASLMAEDFFDENVDFIIRGNGLSQFRSLVSRIQQGEKEISLEDGFIRRGETFYLSKAEPELSGTAFFLPDRSVTSAIRHNYQMLDLKPIALMRTSYGCPFRCSFCSLWGLNQGKYHLHDADEVIRDLENIRETNIHFVDDEPWLKPERMESLAERIIEAGIRKSFLLYARIDTLLDRTEIIEKWMKAGLTKVILGVEAVTSKELLEYGKKITLAQIEKAYQLLRSMGLDSVSLFIVKPDYQEKDFTRLKRFIIRNKVSSPMFTILTPLPGTAMMKSDFQGIESLGVNGRPDWYQWDLQHPVVKTFLPRDRFIEEYKKLRVINL